MKLSIQAVQRYTYYPAQELLKLQCALETYYNTIFHNLIYLPIRFKGQSSMHK